MRSPVTSTRSAANGSVIVVIAVAERCRRTEIADADVPRRTGAIDEIPVEGEIAPHRLRAVGVAAPVPGGPQPVDVGMMQEEDRIARRQRDHRHVAADRLVHAVVRIELQSSVAEPGRRCHDVAALFWPRGRVLPKASKSGLRHDAPTSPPDRPCRRRAAGRWRRRAADETADWSCGRRRRTPPGIAGPRSSSSTAARSRACPTTPDRCARRRGCRRGATAGSTSWRADRNCGGCRRSGSSCAHRTAAAASSRATARRIAARSGSLADMPRIERRVDDCALRAERRIATEQRKRRAAGDQKRASVEHAKPPSPDGEEVSNVRRQTNSTARECFRAWLSRLVSARG